MSARALSTLLLCASLIGCAAAPNRVAPKRAAPEHRGVPACARRDLQIEFDDVEIRSDGSLCGEVLLGSRRMRSDDLGRVDRQFVTGCRFSATDKKSGIGIELGVQGSNQEDDRDDDRRGANSSRLDEFYMGLYALFGGGGRGLHPYVGVGVSFLETRTDIFTGEDDVVEDATVLGGYTNFGLALISKGGFRLSLDWRSMRGVETASGADADYDQVALVAGVSF